MTAIKMRDQFAVKKLLRDKQDIFWDCWGLANNLWTGMETDIGDDIHIGDLLYDDNGIVGVVEFGYYESADGARHTGIHVNHRSIYEVLTESCRIVGHVRKTSEGGAL